MWVIKKDADGGAGGHPAPPKGMLRMDLQSLYETATGGILRALRARLRETLGAKLLGLYLYGSLVWGDFDERRSDVDMLAVLDGDITDCELASLEAMHDAFAREYPAWRDRIEVQYNAADALAHWWEPRRMANISPGEPLHIITSGEDWLTNWYFVQDYGVPLWGPPADRFIPPIAKREFLRAVYDHAMQWRTYVEGTRGSRPYQAYAMLTMCRAYCTLSTGEQVSKQAAARWVREALPMCAADIDAALDWRENADERMDAAASFERARAFVTAMSDRVRARFERP